MGAPLVGAILAGVQYFDTHLWQAVVLSYIGAPFIGAYIIVLAPLLLQLLPRGGGLGERLGLLLAPFNLCSVVLAYVAAIVIDATGNYRLIWVFPAATGLAHAAVNCWLKFPPRKASSPDMVKQLWEWSVVQAESMAETGIVTGLLAAPLLGVVTKEDADSAVVIDMARNILGDPYAVDEPEVTTAALGPGGDPGDPGGPSNVEPGQSSSGGGVFGVTGVRQVGGGPEDGRAMGDQKSGWGEPTGVEAAESSSGAASAAGGGGGGSDVVGIGATESNGKDAGGLDGGESVSPSVPVASSPVAVPSIPVPPPETSGSSGVADSDGTAGDGGDAAAQEDTGGTGPVGGSDDTG